MFLGLKVSSRNPVLLTVLTMGLVLLSGCGRGPGNRVPVKGVVTFDARPLAGGTVIFSPDAKKGNTSKDEPRGKIDEQGRFEMLLHGQPGVPVGWYKVAVASVKGNGLGVKPTYLVPQSYANPLTSGLGPIEVVRDPAPEAYDIKLARKR